MINNGFLGEKNSQPPRVRDHAIKSLSLNALAALRERADTGVAEPELATVRSFRQSETNVILDAGSPQPIMAHSDPIAPISGETISGETISNNLISGDRIRADAAPPPRPTPVFVTPEEREQFVRDIFVHKERARAFVAELISKGVPRDTLLLDLFTNAARRLGVMWERDQCDFMEVTMGVSLLHKLLRTSQSSFQRILTAHAPSVLLTTAGGDQHVFGLAVLADFYRRAGWRVIYRPDASRQDIIQTLSACDIELLGLSASSDVYSDDIEHDIAAFRKSARNQRLSVVVGGRLFDNSPEFAAGVGADAHISNAQQAPNMSRNLIAH